MVLDKSSDQRITTWPAKDSAWSTAFEKFCRTVFKTYCPLSIEGTHNLPESPFMICSNHSSHLDSGVLMASSGLPFNQAGLIAAKDYFFDQSHRFLLHYMMNLVPIARGTGPSAIKVSMVACRSFLHSGGKVLIIYPEGTRAMSSKMGKFKQGAAILAHDLDIPMVPAYIEGANSSLPKGAYFLRPRKLKVTFGKSLRVLDYLSEQEESPRKALFQAYRESTAELERRVRALAMGHEG